MSDEQKKLDVAVLARFLMDGLVHEVEAGIATQDANDEGPAARFVDEFENVETFAAAGIISNANGFVVHLSEGRRYTVTVAPWRSR